MEDNMKNINAIQSHSFQDSMKPPSPEVRAKIDEILAMNPRQDSMKPPSPEVQAKIDEFFTMNS